MQSLPFPCRQQGLWGRKWGKSQAAAPSASRLLLQWVGRALPGSAAGRSQPRRLLAALTPQGQNQGSALPSQHQPWGQGRGTQRPRSAIAHKEGRGDSCPSWEGALQGTEQRNAQLPPSPPGWVRARSGQTPHPSPRSRSWSRSQAVVPSCPAPLQAAPAPGTEGRTSSG